MSNPKDAVGRTKPPLGLFPVSAILQGAMALFAGKTKYGRSNWRATPVHASVYFEAGLRHFYKWWEGEEFDPEDGTPHLGNVLACVAIIIDARVCGTLVDDRQFNGAGTLADFNSLNHLVPKLEAQYADKKPKHYTIADAVAVTVPASVMMSKIVQPSPAGTVTDTEDGYRIEIRPNTGVALRAAGSIDPSQVRVAATHLDENRMFVGGLPFAGGKA